MKQAGKLIIGYDLSETSDLPCLCVFERCGEDVICKNTFYGEDASRIYNELMGEGDTE